VTLIRWTPEAADDLEALRDFIARDSEHYAQLVVRRILATIDRLEQFLLSGRIPPEKTREDVREP
jgi:plasmid stabilization system protein ParE